MESIEMYSSDLTAASNGKIIKKRDGKSLAVSLALLVAGIVSTIASGSVNDHGTATYMLLITLGIALIVIGSIYLFFGSKSKIYAPTGSAVASKSLFFEEIDKERLWNAVTGERYEELKKFKRGQGSGIRLDIQSSADKKFAGLQVFTYVPYTYAAAGPVYCLYDEKAEQMLEALGV